MKSELFLHSCWVSSGNEGCKVAYSASWSRANEWIGSDLTNSPSTLEGIYRILKVAAISSK